MSFGVSSSDVVFFSSFAAKVISSLKEEGGSKAEYQLAEQQCQAFLSVMNEIQSLDLSNLPDSFRSKLAVYSTNVQGFVEDFQKNIERYEKSMGETSTRGAVLSAPRKIQWAFTAAEDLNKFRQSLTAQLDIVKIVIQTSILSILGNHQGTSLVQRPTGSAYRQGLLQPNAFSTNHPDQDVLLRTSNHLVDLVYERLATKPGFLEQTYGRVFTLPSDVDFQTLPPEYASTGQADKRPALQPDIQLSSAAKYILNGDTKADVEEPRNLIADIDEYLTSLNLEGLSENEKAEIHESKRPPGKLLLNGSSEDKPDKPNKQLMLTTKSSGEPSESAAPQANGQQGKQGRKSNKKDWSFSPGIALDPLTMAASLVQTVALTAQLSVKLSMMFREAKDAPRQLEVLSKRLMQYSGLLKAAAEIVRTSMPTGELQELCWETLKDSGEAIGRVERLLIKFESKSGSSLGRLLKLVSWGETKKEIEVIMEEMESLKSTLSFMLQLYQIKMSESSLG